MVPDSEACVFFDLQVGHLGIRGTVVGLTHLARVQHLWVDGLLFSFEATSSLLIG